MSKIFKICDKDEWEETQNNTLFEGSKNDQIDGFIHFSTREQLKETLEIHFRSKNNLYLLEVNSEKLDIVWEIGRNKELFPHLYQPLPLAKVVRVHRIFIDARGNHLIPETVFDT